MFDEFQLERFCENNLDCGCRCYRCPAFARHYREELGYEDDDEDEEFFDRLEY